MPSLARHSISEGGCVSACYDFYLLFLFPWPLLADWVLRIDYWVIVRRLSGGLDFSLRIILDKVPQLGYLLFAKLPELHTTPPHDDGADGEFAWEYEV